MKERSLSWRIIATVLTAELICGLLFSGIALLHERHAHFHAFDVMLHGRADSLLGALQDKEDAGDHLVIENNELSLPADDAYLVTETNGNVIGQSPRWNSDFRIPSKAGYTTETVHGISFRVYRAESTRLLDAEDNGGIRRSVIVVYAVPLAHMWHAIFEGVRFYIVATIILLALTAFALAAALRRVMSPLTDLAEQAGRVSTQSWSFHPSEEILRTRELKPLASSIQTLLQNLEREFAERRRFVSDAAHELKTELAVIKSSLQLLGLRHRTADEYLAGLERPIENTQRMELLVNRMLTLGRVDEAPEVDLTPVDLGTVVERIIRQLEPVAALRGISLNLSADAAAWVALNESDAEILCSNLLTNAIEHSADSTISTSLVARSRTATLRIADRGEGIPPDALPHVFDRFFRVDKSRTRKTGGSGLGLSICKAIVTAAGGSIALESTLGEGTTVSVELPLRPLQAGTFTEAAQTAALPEATHGSPILS